MNLKIVGLSIVVLVIVGGIAVYEVMKKPTATVNETPPPAITITTSPKEPQLRIVSLTPSDTQHLIALGLGKYIVGLDRYSYTLLQMVNRTSCIPRNVTVFPRITPVNISGLVALNPTVVVGEKGILSRYEGDMQKVGLNTFFTNADYASNFYQIENCIYNLAKYFNKTDSAMKLIEWMNSKLQEFSTTGNKTVAYITWIYPDYYFRTAGGNVFINSLIQLGGGINAFANCKNYPKLCSGKLIEANPDIIVVREVYNISYTKYLLYNIPGIQNTTAYKEGKIYFLCCNSYYLVSQPGPLAVYAVLLFHYIINGTAPNTINWSWVMENIKPELPVF